MVQDDKFLNGEGDAWFSRNESLLVTSDYIDTDVPLYFLDKYSLHPRSVLEIGCSNGWRLAEIMKRRSCRALGVESSEKAIIDGRQRYPGVEFKRALAHSLGEVGAHDLVIVNYILHWVSREKLLASVTEIDRGVAEKGYLVIGDFLPDSPSMNSYSHLAEGEVFTYKLDYAGIFLATGMYNLVARLTYFEGADKPEFDKTTDTKTRGSCTLLRKSQSGFYAK